MYSKSPLKPMVANLYLPSGRCTPSAHNNARSSQMHRKIDSKRPGVERYSLLGKAAAQKCVKYEWFFAFSLCAIGSSKSLAEYVSFSEHVHTKGEVFVSRPKAGWRLMHSKGCFFNVRPPSPCMMSGITNPKSDSFSDVSWKSWCEGCSTL